MINSIHNTLLSPYKDKKVVPREIWGKIVAYLEGKDLISFGFVSRACFNLCVQYPVFKFHCTINVIVKIQSVSSPILGNKTFLLRPHALHAFDTEGRSYHMGYVDWGDPAIIYILDPNKNNMSILDLSILNLGKDEQDILSNSILINRDGIQKKKMDNFPNCYTACFPIAAGLITTHLRSIAVWKFEEDFDRPKLKNFISFTFNVRPCGYYEGNFFFIAEKKLYIFEVENHNVHEIDINNASPLSEDGYFANFLGKLCYINSSQIVEIQINAESKSICFPTQPLPFSTRIHDRKVAFNDVWRLHNVEKTEQLTNESSIFYDWIQVIKGTEVWIDPDTKPAMELKWPQAEQGERFFLFNDFLFLCYSSSQKKIRIIHLPTKQECDSSQLTHLIQKNLPEKRQERRDWILYFLKIEENKVEMIIQTTHTSFTNRPLFSLELLTFSFDVVTFPFSIFFSPLKNNEADIIINSHEHLNKKDDAFLKNAAPPVEGDSNKTNTILSTQEQSNSSSEKNPLEKIDEQNLSFPPSFSDSKMLVQSDPADVQRTFTSNHKKEKSTIQATIDKVILLVGGIFLILSIIGTTCLIVWHPGRVLFEGSGLILTLPAVLTLSIGGGVSLMLIAIGSYRWWSLSHKIDLLRNPISCP